MNRKLIIEDDSVYEIDEVCMKKKSGRMNGEKADPSRGTEKSEYRRGRDEDAGTGKQTHKQRRNGAVK